MSQTEMTPNRRIIIKRILCFIAALWIWLLGAAPALGVAVSETLASVALDVSGSIAIFIVVGYVLGKSMENIDFFR